MDKVEAVFDAVQAQLDENGIKRWKSCEVDTLLLMLKTYYEDLQKQRVLAKQRHKARHNDDDEDVDGEGDATGEEEEEEDAAAIEREVAVAEVDRALAKVRAFIQQRVPFGALQEPSARPYGALESAECTRRRRRTVDGATEAHGGAADAVAPVTYAIDAFLYLEEDIEELVSIGAVSRHYCVDCGSTNLAPTDFITHSFSQDQLVFLSCFLLPALSKELPEASTGAVLDVGSRFGVVLWACYFAAQQGLLRTTERVVGVELDSRYVRIQNTIGQRLCARPVPLPGPLHRTAERTTEQGGQEEEASRCFTWAVVEGDCFVGEGAKALADAGVVILHNVFEFFCGSEMEHLQCWLKLRSLVTKRGTVLICSPSIEETLRAFSEETLEVCGILPKDDTRREKPKGTPKRPREKEKEKEKEKEEALASQGSRKDLAVARWIADYVEPLNDTVAQLAEDFIAFRAAVLPPHSDDDDDDDDGGGCSTSRPRGKESAPQQSPLAAVATKGEEEDEESEEITELKGQIRSIWAYRVR